jgi:hypothetical protein
MDTDLTRQSVTKATASLEAQGIIAVERTKGRVRNTYTLLFMDTPNPSENNRAENEPVRKRTSKKININPSENNRVENEPVRKRTSKKININPSENNRVENERQSNKLKDTSKIPLELDARAREGEPENQTQQQPLPIPDSPRDAEHLRQLAVEANARRSENERLPDSEIDAFCAYWTECNKKGKMRYEMRDAFQVGRRLVTWYGNYIRDQQKHRQPTPADFERRTLRRQNATNINSMIDESIYEKANF